MVCFNGYNLTFSRHQEMDPRHQPNVVESSLLLQGEHGSKHMIDLGHRRETQTDSESEQNHIKHHHAEALPQPGGTNTSHKLSFSERLAASWVFEVMGLIVSAMSLTAMVLILIRHNGQRIPDWGALSFNTVISILAVASKMAALYGATSAISQLKWVWFTEHGKQLVDYKTFDNGSRGMAGAMALAWSLRGRHAAALGALAVVIGAAAGPFAQQIVHFYEQEYVDGLGTAWVSKGETVAALGPRKDFSSWSPDPALKANAMMALLLPTQEVMSHPLFSCATGNCTWDSFTTLRLCSTCVDVSSHLNHNCSEINNLTEVKSCNVAFPGESSLNLFYIADPDYPGTSTYMVVNSTMAENSTALQHLKWPSTIYQSIRAVVPPTELGGGQDPNLINNGIHLLKEDTRFIGSECALSPCAQHIKASVSQGAYVEEVLEIWSEFEYDNFTSPIVISPPWMDGDSLKMIAEWAQSIMYAFGSSDPLGGQLMGSVETHDSNQGILVTDIPAFGMPRRENDALQATFYADFSETSCPTPDDNFACAFRALGAAATKSIRDAGMLKNGTGSPNVAAGNVYTTGTFIRIEWPWFALPAAIWVLSTVTVIIAMIKSKHMPLSRDSVWPLVLLSGEGGAVKEAREVDLKIRAETVGVQLVGDERTGLKLLTRIQ